MSEERYAEFLLEAIEKEDFRNAKKLLLDLRADPNLLIQKRGIAPIHYVAGMPNFEFAQNLMKVILENGGNPNVKSVDDETPLHVAVFSQHVVMVQMLLDSGADVQIRDGEGKTPISYAIEEKSMQLIRLFRKHICMQKIEEKPSKTPSKNFLAIPSNSSNSRSPSIVLTPNRTEFNYNAISPYFVSVSRRRRWNEPAKDKVDHVSRRISVDTSITADESTVHTLNISDLITSDDEPESELVEENLFQLTEDNLEKHKRSAQKINRRSMVDQWRTKVNRTRGLPDSTNMNTVLEQFGNAVTTATSTPSSRESVWTVIKVDQAMNGHDATTQKCGSFVTAIDDVSFVIASPKPRDTILQTMENYRHTDTEDNITFYETKLLADPLRNPNAIDLNEGLCESKTDVSDVTIPLDYDTDVLREELTLYGAPPGPITKNTKHLYLRKLMRFQRNPGVASVQIERQKCFQNFSIELQKFLRDENSSTWIEGITVFLEFEKQMQDGFKAASNKCFREGNLKTSFNYLLLDPRIAENLPGEAQLISKHDIWTKFIRSIFYVGKGKSSRPYEHLYEAIKLHQGGASALREKKCYNRSKIERIIEIWNCGKGVICLPVFHNTLPIEAFSREAAMIDCLGVKNLTNLKRGDYYGTTLSWPMRCRKQLGVLLLYKAMKIFLQEGESQLRPDDIRRNYA